MNLYRKRETKKAVIPHRKSGNEKSSLTDCD
nr:MAG TPA: hypothetical protein [Caudoviricetes sp.]